MFPRNNSFKTSQILAFVITLLPICMSQNAFAAKATQPLPDEEQPVNISADSLEADEKQGKSIYSGHVVITQGSLTLKGNVVTIQHPNSEVKSIQAQGSPSTFQRFSPKDQRWIKGHANQIEYNALDKTVLLLGDAFVEQPGEHVITGPKLFYDLTKQTLKAQSTPNEKKRISVTINPAKSKTTAK